MGKMQSSAVMGGRLNCECQGMATGSRRPGLLLVGGGMPAHPSHVPPGVKASKASCTNLPSSADSSCPAPHTHHAA